MLMHAWIVQHFEGDGGKILSGCLHRGWTPTWYVVCSNEGSTCHISLQSTPKSHHNYELSLLLVTTTPLDTSVLAHQCLLKMAHMQTNRVVIYWSACCANL